MFDKLDFLEEKYNKLNETIADPAVIADQERWRKLMKEQKDLTPIVEKYKQYKKARYFDIFYCFGWTFLL